jgi:hypothetical protein
MVRYACFDPMKMWLTAVALAGVSLSIVPADAAAQGRVRRPRPPKTPAGRGTGGRTQLPVASGTLTLPTWLDDAETLDPGSVIAELSAGRWTSLDGGETDAPVFDLALGVAPLVQVNVSLSYYRASYSDGYRAQGLGDTYLSAKVQLLDPSEHRVGIAVMPMLEILSEASVSDRTLGLPRANWGLPVSIQVGSGQTRAYSTIGYMSRDAALAGLAVEQDLGTRLTLIGSISSAYATRTSPASDLHDLSRSRTDATAMAYFGVTPLVSVFAGAGRTISQLDQNGATLIASAGVRIQTDRRARP